MSCRPRHYPSFARTFLVAAVIIFPATYLSCRAVKVEALCLSFSVLLLKIKRPLGLKFRSTVSKQTTPPSKWLLGPPLLLFLLHRGLLETPTHPPFQKCLLEHPSPSPPKMLGWRALFALFRWAARQVITSRYRGCSLSLSLLPYRLQAFCLLSPSPPKMFSTPPH